MDLDIDTLAAALADKLAPTTPRNFRHTMPFRLFANLYITQHSKPRKKTWREDERRLSLYLIPTFGDTLLCDIKRSAVIALHADIGTDKPVQANRVLEQLTTMFRMAQLWDLYPANELPPTAGIKPFKEQPRDVFVQRAEMDRLAKSIDSCRARHYRVLFWLYLLTGLRRSELLNAKWSDLDKDRWELRVLKNKSDRPHHVPLTAEAMALLDSLPKRSVYIFPGASPNKPIHKTSVWNAWNRVRKRANLQHVRIHDLRRTVASWMAQSGQPLSLIGKLLNHSSARATEIYARFAQDDVRQALQKQNIEVGKFMNRQT